MSPHKSVVAIVDDDAGVLTGLKRVLGAHGFITETFNSGEAFLNGIKRLSLLVLSSTSIWGAYQGSRRGVG